jgi:hypothetical protein
MNFRILNIRIVIIGFLFFFFFYSLKSTSQSLKWIDNYKIRPVVGVSFRPIKGYVSKIVVIGGMGGISVFDPKRRLGLNLRLNYMIPIILVKDTIFEDEIPYFYYYLELTYKIFKYDNGSTKISLGIVKPSPKINPYFGCPYCPQYYATFSAQQEFNRFNIELRFNIPIGDNYGGWYFTRWSSVEYSLGINYTFSLPKKEN